MSHWNGYKHFGIQLMGIWTEHTFGLDLVEYNCVHCSHFHAEKVVLAFQVQKWLPWIFLLSVAPIHLASCRWRCRATGHTEMWPYPPMDSTVRMWIKEKKHGGKKWVEVKVSLLEILPITRCVKLLKREKSIFIS